MTIQMRPTRMQLNDRFPMLGFTIRTSGDVGKYEVAIASDPNLFAPGAKPQRNRSNFYSSRAQGPLPAGRDESVFVLPPEVLVRFIGQPKLYFAVAGYNGAGPAKAEIGPLPSAASPYIDLTGLSGRSLRRVRILPSRQRMEAGYGTGGAELEWAGDAASPGLQPVATEKPNGKPASGNPAPGNTAMPANPPAAAAKAAALADYTDGFGPLPPVSPPTNPTTATPSSGHANDAHIQAYSEHIAPASRAPVQQRALATNPVTPLTLVRHAKRPYGSAVDPRAAALSDEIPLDPGNGGMSIGPDALQIGDIILSTTDAASSGLIRFGTGSPVSHAMLYVDQGQQVIEAIGSGVAFRALADAIGPATLAVAFRAPGLDDAHRQLIADAAVTHVGEPYDNIGIIRQAKFQIDRHICDLLNGEAATTCRSFVGYVDLGTPRPGTFFCSELVLAAYAAAGAPLTTTPFNWSNPNDLVELAFRDGALAYVGHLKAPPVSSSRSIFGLGLSADALAEDEAAALGDRFGPEVGRVVRELLGQGVSEQDVGAFLRQLQSNETAAAPSAAMQTLVGARGLAQQETAITIPPVQTLDGWRAKIVLTIVLTALGGPIGTAAAQALPDVANRYRLCFGIGPGLNAGLLEGGSLSCGIVVAPGGKLGFFGRLEEAVGTLSGISAALQVTITKGDLDHFGGSGYAVGLDIGHIEGFGVAGGAALLDENRHFHGISIQLGVGVEAQPVELYLAAEHTYATSQGLSVETRRHKKAQALARSVGFRQAPATALATGDFTWPAGLTEGNFLVTAFIEAYNQRVGDGVRGNPPPDPRQYSVYSELNPDTKARDEALKRQIPRIASELQSDTGRESVSQAILQVTTAVSIQALAEIRDRLPASLYQVVLAGGPEPAQSANVVLQGLTYVSRRIGMFMAWVDVAIQQATTDTAERLRAQKEQWDSLLAIADGGATVLGLIPGLGEAMVIIGAAIHGVLQSAAPDFGGHYASFDMAMRGVRRAYTALAATTLKELIKATLGQQNLPDLDSVHPEVQAYLDAHSAYALQGWEDELAFLGYTVGAVVRAQAASAQVAPRIVRARSLEVAPADFVLPPPPPPKPRAQALDAGVTIKSPVPGVMMRRITGSDASVSWEANQMIGLKHPNDEEPSQIPPLHDATTVHLIDWPYLATPSGRISADLTVDWQYTGASLGNVRIAVTGSKGVPPQTLKVQAHILDDTMLHPREAPHMAGLRVRVRYQFSRPGNSDAIALIHLRLFGDGTYDQNNRWEQN